MNGAGQTDHTPIPIIVTVFHREENTRRMLEQLDRVTEGYSLVIVNNGFDDPGYLMDLGPAHYIENGVNTGAIRPINQGLEVARGDYLAVLHSDLLIFERGWLDRIVRFMDARPDVGLVGLAGRQTVLADGTCDLDSTVLNHRGHYPECWKPSWRFTEVAAVDGLGWVMRDLGLRLDEGLGMMHCYDLDLSLQYIQAGYRVYVADVDILHLAADPELSCRSSEQYLERIGVDDDTYFAEVRGRFIEKWGWALPITRGFREQPNAELEAAELETELEELRIRAGEGDRYVAGLEEDCRAKDAELRRVLAHAAKVREDNRTKDARIRLLEEKLSRMNGSRDD